MKDICFKIQLLICFIPAVFCSLAAAELPKLKFVPGDKYLLVSGSEQKMSRVMDGNEKSMEQAVRFECNLDVDEVDDSGNAWTKYTYKRIVMTQSSKEQKFEFDSDTNQLRVPLQAMPLQAIVGESIYVRITPQGHIDKVNGVPALIASAKGKIGNFPGADIVMQNIGIQFEESGIKRSLEEQFAVFPDSNNGETVWTSREIVSSAEFGFFAKSDYIDDVNIVFEKTFRLSEKPGKSGVSVVDINLVIQPEATPAATTQTSDNSVISPIKMSREITGSGVSQVEIENATGRIIINKATQDITERIKKTTQNQMLRPMAEPEPIVLHRVMSFQMTKIKEGKPAEKVKNEATPEADSNEKGAI